MVVRVDGAAVNTLSVVFYGALLVAVAASVAAVVSPRLRTRLLVLAGVLYTSAGVLGILSIGVIFLGAAVLCFALAARGRAAASASSASVGVSARVDHRH